MKIHVTQEHIDKGRKCDCSSCPVALALMDHLVDATPVVKPIGSDDKEKYAPTWAALSRLRIGNWIWRTPLAVWHFMRAFDAGNQPGPFEFELSDEPEEHLFPEPEEYMP